MALVISALAIAVAVITVIAWIADAHARRTAWRNIARARRIAAEAIDHRPDRSEPYPYRNAVAAVAPPPSTGRPRRSLRYVPPHPGTRPTGIPS